MRRFIEVPRPIRPEKLTQVLWVRGVPVYLHWSVLLISALILANVVRSPLTSLAGLISYYSVLLIHESGHALAAKRLHCEVCSIEIYPIFAITRFETPWSRLDHCIIAASGVIAQAIFAIPFVLWVAFLGYPRFQAVDAVLAICGFLSLAIAAFNLLPIRPLDGSIAWGIIPESIRRLRNTRRSTPPAWKQR